MAGLWNRFFLALAGHSPENERTRGIPARTGNTRQDSWDLHTGRETIGAQAYDEMFERSPLAQAILDENLRFIAVNKAFCSLMGYSRESLIGMEFTDLRTRGLVKYLVDTADSCTKILSTKQDLQFESRFETASGIHIMIQSCQPILDENRDVKYIYNTYTDITKIMKNQEYMAQEIDEFIAAYDKMAKGDLTVSHIVEKPDDPDLRRTYDLLEKLRGSVRGIISNLQANIRDVNSRMQNLTVSAETASRGVEDASRGLIQISHDAADVTNNTRQVSQGMTEISKAMQDMSASIEEITSRMESVSIRAKETNDLSQKGAGLAGKAEQSMCGISESSGKVYSIVTDVEKQMNEISKIVFLIRELANQTNLLALNAAIEAARAGDAGRGFAMVAAEVKSLAQESRISAERIEDMITSLTKNTQNASLAMGEAKEVVEHGSKMITETLHSFNRIVSSIDEVAKSASEVAAAAQEQAATTEQIVANVHEITSLVDATVKDASNAAGATEESSNALEEITGIVQTINSLAAEALEANRKFRVD